MVNQEKMMEFAFKAVGDMAAAFSGPLIYIGDRLGLFKTIAAQGPLTVEQLTEKTKLQLRYLQEWTAAMTASGYLDFDPQKKSFSLSPEKAMVLANEDSPVFVQGGFQMIPDHYAKIEGIMRCMKEGGGIPYTEYGSDTFVGTERFFRPGYINFLVQQWIPATGFEERLKTGAKVADVGCGRGWAIITMAKAYPKSQFIGFDNYEPSLQGARENAKKAGVSNVTFQICDSAKLPQTGDFDLICNLDSLHDMTSPEDCAKSVKGALKSDGAWLVLEPNVSDRLEENVNPVGRAFYSVSMLQCMTVSLAHGGKGYGACMGPGRVEKVATGAGFRKHERLPIENPFNRLTLSRP